MTKAAFVFVKDFWLNFTSTETSAFAPNPWFFRDLDYFNFGVVSYVPEKYTEKGLNCKSLRIIGRNSF